MTPFRYRDEDEPTHAPLYLMIGALAGLTAGVVLAERFGGLSGITERVRDRLRGPDTEFDSDDYEYEGGELSESEAMEERVLEAFRNDPILSERAVDIGAVAAATIELSGWVHTTEETEHAVIMARGVPGVTTVVNRLDVRLDDFARDEVAELYASDPTSAEGHWEGQQIGTGRRRQGTSDEWDRHADPKPGLEDRWLSTEKAIEDAADDIDTGGGHRRGSAARRGARRDRAGGAPTAPTGVPKADHVARGDDDTAGGPAAD